MNAMTVAFVGAAAYLFPPLRPSYEEHLDMFEEVIPHMYMADITRWVVDTFVSDPSDPALRQVLDFLEAGWNDNPVELDDLLAASFLENLPYRGEPGWQVRDVLGSSLKARFAQTGHP